MDAYLGLTPRSPVSRIQEFAQDDESFTISCSQFSDHGEDSKGQLNDPRSRPLRCPDNPSNMISPPMRVRKRTRAPHSNDSTMRTGLEQLALTGPETPMQCVKTSSPLQRIPDNTAKASSKKQRDILDAPGTVAKRSRRDAGRRKALHLQKQDSSDARMLSYAGEDRNFFLVAAETARKQRKFSTANKKSRYLQMFDEKVALGSGSFCSVYMCRHRVDGCTYAIKKTTGSLSDRHTRRRAIKEVFALAAMADCEYIARYFSVWQEDDKLYIQLELGWGSLEAALMGKRPTQKLTTPEIVQAWRDRQFPVPTWVRVFAHVHDIDIDDDPESIRQLIQEAKWRPGSAAALTVTAGQPHNGYNTHAPPSVARPVGKSRPRIFSSSPKARKLPPSMSFHSRTNSMDSQDDGSHSPRALFGGFDNESQSVSKAMNFAGLSQDEDSQNSVSYSAQKKDSLFAEIEASFLNSVNADVSTSQPIGRKLTQKTLSFAPARTPETTNKCSSTKLETFNNSIKTETEITNGISCVGNDQQNRLETDRMTQITPTQALGRATQQSTEPRQSRRSFIKHDEPVSFRGALFQSDDANDGFGDTNQIVSSQAPIMLSQASMCSLEAFTQCDEEHELISSLDPAYRPRLPCSEWDIRRVMHDIAAALAYMHARDVVHLDVKPANVLVDYGSGPGMCDQEGDWLPCVKHMTGIPSWDDQIPAPMETPNKNNKTRLKPLVDVRYKLADLGQAARANATSVEDGDARYMSPELMNGDISNLKSADIFAFGLMMCEIAAGIPLPQTDDEYHAFRSGKLPSMPQCSLELVELIRAMTNPDPNVRPSASKILTHPLVANASSYHEKETCHWTSVNASRSSRMSYPATPLPDPSFNGFASNRTALDDPHFTSPDIMVNSTKRHSGDSNVNNGYASMSKSGNTTPDCEMTSALFGSTNVTPEQSVSELHREIAMLREALENEKRLRLQTEQ